MLRATAAEAIKGHVLSLFPTSITCWGNKPIDCELQTLPCKWKCQAGRSCGPGNSQGRTVAGKLLQVLNAGEWWPAFKTAYVMSDTEIIHIHV